MEIHNLLKNYGIDLKDFSGKILKDGAIPARVKRLIAIGCAAAIGCDHCVEHHVKLAREEGISEEEIVEAVLVASLVRFGSGIRFLVSSGRIYSENNHTR